MSYINREKLINSIMRDYGTVPLSINGRQLLHALVARIENQPSVSVEEIKYGEWSKPYIQ